MDIIFALFYLVWDFSKIIKNSNNLTMIEYEDYEFLPETKIY
jgi:hypothetical protein